MKDCICQQNFESNRIIDEKIRQLALQYNFQQKTSQLFAQDKLIVKCNSNTSIDYGTKYDDIHIRRCNSIANETTNLKSSSEVDVTMHWNLWWKFCLFVDYNFWFKQQQKLQAWRFCSESYNQRMVIKGDKK